MSSKLYNDVVARSDFRVIDKTVNKDVGASGRRKVEVDLPTEKKLYSIFGDASIFNEILVHQFRIGHATV